MMRNFDGLLDVAIDGTLLWVENVSWAEIEVVDVIFFVMSS